MIGEELYSVLKKYICKVNKCLIKVIADHFNYLLFYMGKYFLNLFGGQTASSKRLFIVGASSIHGMPEVSTVQKAFNLYIYIYIFLYFRHARYYS